MLSIWSRYYRNTVIVYNDICGTKCEDHTALGKILNVVLLKRTITFNAGLSACRMVNWLVSKSVRQSASQGGSQWYTCWADILSSCLLLGLLDYTLTEHIHCGCNWGIPTGHLHAYNCKEVIRSATQREEMRSQNSHYPRYHSATLFFLVH